MQKGAASKFALITLIAVIAIVSILASSILPMLSRGSVARTPYAAGLSQMGSAARMYDPALRLNSSAKLLSQMGKAARMYDGPQ